MPATPSTGPPKGPALSEIHSDTRLDAGSALDLLSTGAKILFENGQTTERTVAASEQLAGALGLRLVLFPHWGELIVRIANKADARYEIFAARPAGVDINKVAATMDAIDRFSADRLNAAELTSTLETIMHLPGVSTPRFAAFAAAGAAALAIIFGASHIPSLLLIAFSAGAGAYLRRWLATMSHNLFVQPFFAALLAGVIGAVAVRLEFSSVLRLVAVCPCMVLVPGPHFLNGILDLTRARIVLGASRILYAMLIVVMICGGLLLGLGVLGVSLPAGDPSDPVSLWSDVIAAGIAVSAYCTFFAMPWRMLPIPILVGMAAHALRWVAITIAGTNAAIGALVACIFVGTIMTPIADRARLPFAGLAFASVVSLIPGVFLFRMASGIVTLVELGVKTPQELATQVLADGSTALLIILAMSFGLIFPKLCIGKWAGRRELQTD